MKIEIDFDSESFVKWGFLSFAAVVVTKILFVFGVAIFYPHAEGESLYAVGAYYERLVDGLFADVLVALIFGAWATIRKWGWKPVLFVSVFAGVARSLL